MLQSNSVACEGLYARHSEKSIEADGEKILSAEHGQQAQTYSQLFQ